MWNGLNEPWIRPSNVIWCYRSGVWHLSKLHVSIFFLSLTCLFWLFEVVIIHLPFSCDKLQSFLSCLELLIDNKRFWFYIIFFSPSDYLLVFSASCVTGNGSWCSHSYTFFCHVLHGEQLFTSSSIGQYRGRWVIWIYIYVCVCVWFGFLRHLNVTGLYRNTNTKQNTKCVLM